jgi:hypothetical protein
MSEYIEKSPTAGDRTCIANEAIRDRSLSLRPGGLLMTSLLLGQGETPSPQEQPLVIMPKQWLCAINNTGYVAWLSALVYDFWEVGGDGYVLRQNAFNSVHISPEKEGSADWLCRVASRRSAQRLCELGLIDLAPTMTPEQLKETLVARKVGQLMVPSTGEFCEWCHGQTSALQSHHFPVPRKHGGTEIVKICPNCHFEYHGMESQQRFVLTTKLQQITPISKPSRSRGDL